jgi:hypothetical protein
MDLSGLSNELTQNNDIDCIKDIYLKLQFLKNNEHRFFYLKEIEHKTRYFMKKIIWDDPGSYYYEQSIELQQKFEMGADYSTFLEIYEFLIQLIEECTNESIKNDEIDDDDFLNTFYKNKNT